MKTKEKTKTLAERATEALDAILEIEVEIRTLCSGNTLSAIVEALRTLQHSDDEEVELFDSDTGEVLTADALRITDEVYQRLVDESLASQQTEGHIRPDELDGRRVYAA